MNNHQQAYPFRTQRRQFLHINLPLDEHFDSQVQCFNQTIVLTATLPSHVPSNHTIQQHFAEQYGGLLEDYEIHNRSSTRMFVQLPQHPRPEYVSRQNRAWASQRGCEIRRYTNNWQPFDHPVYRVQIHILDYPLEFWDETCFHEITSGFGVVHQILDEDGDGGDRGTLKLWVDCRNPFDIPEFVIMDFDRSWCKCKVVIRAWRLNTLGDFPQQGALPTTHVQPWLLNEPPEGTYYPVSQMLMNHHLRYLNTMIGNGENRRSSGRAHAPGAPKQVESMTVKRESYCSHGMAGLHCKKSDLLTEYEERDMARLPTSDGINEGINNASATPQKHAHCAQGGYKRKISLQRDM